MAPARIALIRRHVTPAAALHVFLHLSFGAFGDSGAGSGGPDREHDRHLDLSGLCGDAGVVGVDTGTATTVNLKKYSIYNMFLAPAGIQIIWSFLTTG